MSLLEFKKYLISLLAKTKRRVDCWNIRTLFQVGKPANVMKEYKKNGLDKAGFGEIWISTDEYILYSCSEEDHQTEVGLTLK